jgi:hypothetical protein
MKCHHNIIYYGTVLEVADSGYKFFRQEIYVMRIEVFTIFRQELKTGKKGKNISP